MRNPEHQFIQVAMTAEQADRLEQWIGPSFTLAEFPDFGEMVSDEPDDTPIYFLAVADVGEAMDHMRRVQP